MGSGDFTLPFDLSYEIDLWGRIRRTVTAAREEAQASAADLETARLSLHAELAVDYFEVRSADAQESLLSDTVDAYSKALELTKNRFQGGCRSEIRRRPGADTTRRRPHPRHGHQGACLLSNLHSQQPYVYVRWEWAFPALLRCHVHKSPLRHGCPMCGGEDPLPFGTAPAVMRVLCWNCGENLTGTITGSHVGQVDAAHAIVEKVYRAALRGTSPHSALLGEATGMQFRRFVDDLLQLLAWYPSPDLSPRLTDPRNLYLPFRK
jgi:hypothetical protein